MNAPYRPLDWKKVNTLSDWGAIGLGTLGGSGLLPKAPGTWGTLAALPLAYFFNLPEQAMLKPFFWIFLLLAGVWAGKKFQELFGTADNQNVVIDEAVGLGITAWGAGDHLPTYFVCFILFRFFDILKPPPIRQLDQWSKHSKNAWTSGLGVMVDDVLAGFFAYFIVFLLQTSLVL